MHLNFTTHAGAFAKAAEYQPAVWQLATGDIGQVNADDIAMEEPVSGATMILRQDGTASFYTGG